MTMEDLEREFDMALPLASPEDGRRYVLDSAVVRWTPASDSQLAHFHSHTHTLFLSLSLSFSDAGYSERARKPGSS